MTNKNIRINSDKFISIWKEYSELFTTANPDWGELWENNSLWSAKFLGGKKSSFDSSPIGNFFINKFQHLRYRTEDGSFDLAFSFSENFSKIPYINKNKIQYFNTDEQFYPCSYDIIVEIENESAYAWQEMTKLTWVRCPLKVLITYKSKSDKENEMLVESFTKIISQSNQVVKDNADTEYLLIFGYKTSDSKLNWTYTKFDSDGNKIVQT